MFKKKFLIIPLFLVLTLSACSTVEPIEEYETYRNSMDNFFESVEKLDTQINALDPESENALEELFLLMDSLEKQFKYLSEITVPDNYKATEELACEAYDYMVQANEYFKESFSENSYNEYTLEAGFECYERANKRMHYIIDILNGEIPEDDNVTVELE